MLKARSILTPLGINRTNRLVKGTTLLFTTMILTKHLNATLPLLAFSAALVCISTSAIGRAETLGDTPAVHPLDSLSKKEILETVEILRTAGKTSDTSRYSLITLHEPPKDEVLQFHSGTSFGRQSFAVVYERATNQTSEAIVDLQKRALLSWKQVPGVQPSFLVEDAEILQAAVRADPRFPELVRKRGITDLARVGIGDWPGGYYGDPAESGFRLRRAVFTYHDANNQSDRPIENLTADVNLNTRKVVRWDDGNVVPIPPSGAGLAALPAAPTREAPKPLIIDQPAGPSFDIRHHEVRWQNWHFRFGFNSREGLVLYTVGYEDRGRVRSILYRGSCSEMAVPYGDPGMNWFFKNAFDGGEDSMGRYASMLEPLRDYPGNAKIFNVVLPSETGDWFEIPRAVALYERDGGLLWKHYDKDHSQNEARRARELVLSWVATVGNYDYGFNWVFHQDGSLEMEVLLTGFMECKATSLKTVPAAGHHEGDLKYGRLVAEDLIAVNHQHFFSFRLDMDVDGTNNSVVEMNTSAVPPGTDNPHKNAFTMTETLFHNEQEAERNMSLEDNRHWTVINPSIKDSLGYPVGYTLLPGENSVPYEAPDSWLRKRANFTNAHFWTTPYDTSQMFAAGLYVNQSKGEDGLQRWVEAKRPIQDKDVVVWYTMGITHMPRPEEYPMMAVHKAGFMLVPNAFFVQDPANGVP
jgi:primary-amine oxidase